MSVNNYEKLVCEAMEVINCREDDWTAISLVKALINSGWNPSAWKKPSSELPQDNYEVLGFYHGDTVYPVEYLGDGLWAELQEGQVIAEPKLWMHYPVPVEIDDDGKRLEK